MGLLAALILQAAVPQAVPPAIVAGNEADLRCLAVIAAGDVAAPSRVGVAAGAMYFVGRIDARSPGFDYPAEMIRLIRNGADLVPDRTRCAAELKARGAALVDLSRALAAQTAR